MMINKNKALSFIHLFNKYSVHMYYVPISKINIVPTLWAQCL